MVIIKKRVKVVGNVLIECWKPEQSGKKRVLFSSDHWQTSAS